MTGLLEPLVIGSIRDLGAVDARSRLSVMFDWLWAYLTYRSGTRLITGSGPRYAPRAQRA